MNDTKQNRYQSETLLLFERLIPKRNIRWTVYLLAWAIIGTLSMMHWKVLPRADHPYTLWELYRVKLILWILWGLFTPLILKLTARWRIERPNITTHAIITLFWSIVVTSAYLVFYTELISLNIHFVYSRRGMYEFVFQIHSSYYYLAYLMTVGVEHAIGLYNQYHERQMRMVQLESQLNQAQLRALRGRLQPHFLFNTLHSVVALMRKNENATATDMLTRLSDLLRISLEHLERQEVYLADELEMVGKFIEIEKVRFSDRLTVQLDIEERANRVVVPSFILQPIVENAIKHGIEKRAGDGEISIKASCSDEQLILTVGDNGVGLGNQNSPIQGWGIGLETTRQRLQTAFGENHSFDIGDDPSGGVSVRISLPLTTELAQKNQTKEKNG